MLSVIENLDIMLGGRNLERDESEMSNSGRRPYSPSYNNSMNQDNNFHPNSREGEITPKMGKSRGKIVLAVVSTDCQEY